MTQFKPNLQGEIFNVLRGLPDIAHATAADTVAGDFETDRFEPTGPGISGADIAGR